MVSLHPLSAARASALHPAQACGLLLIASALFLLPFGRAIEIPLAMLSLVGLWAVWRERCLLAGREAAAIRLFLLCCLCYQLPMWLSLPDAVNPARSLTTTLGSLRYLLAGIGVLYLLCALPSDPHHQRLFDALEKTLFAVLALWVGDALLQAASGSNLLGYAAERGYLNGLFGAGENLKLSLALLVLGPPALLGRMRRKSPVLTLLLFLLAVLVLLLTGKRSAWVTLALQCALLALFYRQALWTRFPRVVVVCGLCALFVLPLALNNSRVVERGATLIAAVKAPDYAHVNVATGLRLPIWQGALAMLADNPVNGVGVRGFRYAYAEYAIDGDHFASTDAHGAARASHAHLLLFELLADTGVFGLIGHVALLVLLACAWRRCSRVQRQQAIPWLLSALALAHPLNTQGAWYSSWTASLFWLVLVLAVVRLQPLRRVRDVYPRSCRASNPPG